MKAPVSFPHGHENDLISRKARRMSTFLLAVIAIELFFIYLGL